MAPGFGCVEFGKNGSGGCAAFVVIVFILLSCNEMILYCYLSVSNC